MASKRRGGFGPPELRGTLGTLLRTTTDVVRGALERGARSGRARLDDVRTNRRRQDALAELGEVVLDLIRRGEIDLDELPEARDLVRQLDDFDGSPGDVDDAPRAAARRRFDDRDASPEDRAPHSEYDSAYPHDADDADPGDRPHHGHELGSSFEPPRRGEAPRRPELDAPRPRDARSDLGESSHRGDVPRRPAPGPTFPHRAASSDAPRRPSAADDRRRPADTSPPRRAASDDGTVSSGASLRSTRPTTPARPRAPSETSRVPTKPIKGIWRPDPDAPAPDDVPASPSRRYQLAPDPHRKGGISFDDDDLADYMHPDDVPSTATPPDVPVRPSDPDDREP